MSDLSDVDLPTRILLNEWHQRLLELTEDNFDLRREIAARDEQASQRERAMGEFVKQLYISAKDIEQHFLTLLRKAQELQQQDKRPTEHSAERPRKKTKFMPLYPLTSEEQAAAAAMSQGSEDAVSSNDLAAPATGALSAAGPGPTEPGRVVRVVHTEIVHYMQDGSRV